jgi:hypothetical protein
VKEILNNFFLKKINKVKGFIPVVFLVKGDNEATYRVPGPSRE